MEPRDELWLEEYDRHYPEGDPYIHALERLDADISDAGTPATS